MEARLLVVGVVVVADVVSAEPDGPATGDVNCGSASSNRVCSGLVRGGAGAFLLFERRFRSRSGPSPMPPEPVPDAVVAEAEATNDGVATVAEEPATAEIVIVVVGGIVVVDVDVAGVASSTPPGVL